jgi:transcriptional regulator with XRE-family HTH domain
LDSAHILETLKHALKVRKISYRDLAGRLKMSEAGIKKMFQSESLTVTRLIEICRVMGIGLDALIEAGKNPPVKVLRLSQMQNSFFAKHSNYFLFFLKLIYEGATVEEIVKENHFSSQDVFKFLKKLDDLGLIKLRENGQFDSLYEFPIHITSAGEDLASLKFQLVSDFVKTASKESGKNEGRLGAATFHLSEGQVENFNRDFAGVLDQYMRISRGE